MATALNRRDFLYTMSAAATMSGTLPAMRNPSPEPTKIQPIAGTWFEFQHHATVEGVDWNPQLARFTDEQWRQKIREIADTGMEYVALMATAVYYRTFYPSKIFPSWKLACEDPLEAVLSAADEYGVKFFVGGGFYGDWLGNIITDPMAMKRRLQAIEEITGRYGHHKSFYGWYWPNEVEIKPYFADVFINYVNPCSALARKLSPQRKILIAPYGTRVVKPDDTYVRQLERLDVDIVAYQDEVGVEKSTVDQTPAYYEGLRKAHDRAGRSALWADVEIFANEGEVYKSALIPGPFDRILRQMEAVSPWVDKIMVYQYLGMMNQPGSPAFCGREDSTKLYADYMSWRKSRKQ